MSFPPGVRLPMTRPLYATSTVPSGTMMVQMAPVRPVTMVPVSQVVVRPVMRPVISQSQAAFVRTMQPTLTQVVTNQAVIQAGQQVWIQSAEPAKSAIISKPPELKKDFADNTSQLRAAESSNEPAITVFVGNITDRASDTLVRQLLMKCGSVLSWKRVQGPSGKLQAFGFCEYKDPESALRAIHILHNYALGDKQLLVKVDAKTQELIDNWKKEKGMEEDEKDSTSKLPRVTEALASINALVQGYSSELTVPKSAVEKQEASQSLKLDPTVRDSANVEENLEELQLEEEKKNFISKEIRTFRESQKQQEERLKLFKAEKEKARSREILLRERSRISRNDRDYSRRSRSPRSRRSRSISPVRRSPRRSRTPLRNLIRRVSPRRTPPRRRSRSPPPRRRRSSSRSPSWKRDEEESEREEERRRLDKRIKEKEAAYQERLRNFEAREKRQKRIYEKRAEQEAEEREELVKQAKTMREFLADYDDEKNDNQFYVGSALTKKLNDRELEMEEDKKDKRKETEELNMLRRRLAEENHTDPNSVIAKILAETENIWKPLLEPDSPARDSPSNHRERSSSSSSSSNESDDESDRSISDSSSSSDSSDDQSVEYETEIVHEEPYNHTGLSNYKLSPHIKEEYNAKTGKRSSSVESSLLSGTPSPRIPSKSRAKPTHDVRSTAANNKRLKFTVSDMFNEDEEEEILPQKKKFVPLHLSSEDRKATRSEEKKTVVDKKKQVRALIERIPSDKEDLFRFQVDWAMVDSALMDKRIKPWITKKIVEYIGENEPTLVEFICSKILSKISPTKILEDISMVLDEEAEIFVAKLWRLLIYETEAKKEGLTKA